ncbi:uncharacterized protein M6B38_291970 [Iris pallida]|uniref:DUF632 domain-containing protein n=1 Tax=Iris pallida TaxID=29817 RepID=A0AAX6HV19_IRIPA|nr:uncharacterized protein M6B38_291970 [Iris pallida]
MGCTQSKIDGDEAVVRCRERKQLMKDAVSSRNAFAAAHSAYTVSLRNTGAALSDFAQGQVLLPVANPITGAPTDPSPLPPPSNQPSSSSSSGAAAATVVPPSDAALPPPPPPLPNFAPPLQRAASMPEISLPPKKHKQPAAIPAPVEEGDADDEKDDDAETPIKRTSAAYVPSPPPPGASVWLGEYIFDTNSIPAPSLDHPEEDPPLQPPPRPVTPEIVEKVVDEPEPQPPPPRPKEKPAVKKQKPAPSAGAGEGKRGRTAPVAAGPKANLLQVLNEVDDHFLQASQSAHEVSKMLEATRMHYHSNFADNRGHIDHSARVLRVITWNRSLKGLPKEDEVKDDVDSDESETHATILDKMLAWEKKLYDEVKAGELMKIEYQRKVTLLNKQKKRGASPETLEKTKAVVSHMHTRLIVDMQSMDSTVAEINRLRDKQLYPKLVDLVEGMAKMWETMHMHHDSQRKIVADLRNLDASASPKETSEQHHERTIQLWEVLREWHSQVQKLMKYQKEYIKALNGWLKLNLIPIESSLKENASSSPLKEIRPRIHPLLHAWHDLLEKLPGELATTAIYGFSEVVHTIVIIQEDELKMREKCEETRREYMRKTRAFESWCQKYMEKQAAKAASASEEAASADAEHSEAVNHPDPMADRKAVLEGLKAKLAGEEEAYQRTCKHVREKTAGSLRTHLPELFRAMSEFSLACFEMYDKLFSVTKSDDTTASS